MPPISNRVLAWHTVKTLLFLKLCQALKRNISKNQTFRQISVILALIGGSIFYKLVAAIVDKFFCWLLNMKRLSTMDETFLNDDDKSLSNISIVAMTEPFKYETMDAFFKKKFGESYAMKVRLYDLFGKQYFKSLTEEEWDEMWPKLSTDVKHIHTQEDL